jgi:hypothetical protein
LFVKTGIINMQPDIKTTDDIEKQLLELKQKAQELK